MAKYMNLMNLLLLLFIHFFPTANAVYANILQFGAKADGKTDSAVPFLRAWASACNSPLPSTIYVPAGRFLLSQASFRGPCRNQIKFEILGAIVAPSYYFSQINSHGQWIEFDQVNGVSVYGGTFDGRGASLWACKAAGRSCPDGATTLNFNNAQDIVMSGLRSINSKLYHITINHCQRVRVQDVQIIAPENSPNTDGIHVQMSKNVTIRGASIKTGDDCISIGPGTTNLWIEGITCGPGHGISIGSLGKNYQENGVQNVTVKTVVFRGTQNGLRIKTWGKPSTGFVKEVVFMNALMQNVKNPIIIDQNYCPHKTGCPNLNSGINISQVKYSGIRGSSATRIAVNFDCSPSNPCKGIGLHDIKLNHGNQQSQSLCKHVVGIASGSVVPPSCL